jgi:hypothetical protein
MLRSARAVIGKPLRPPTDNAFGRGYLSMDVRLKSFRAEALVAFGFLVDGGFLPDAAAEPAAGVRPMSVSVTFQGSTARVETSLVLGHMGEEYVVTIIETADGRQELEPAVAHQGHEMKKALREQAAQVQRLLPTASTWPAFFADRGMCGWSAGLPDAS